MAGRVDLELRPSVTSCTMRAIPIDRAYMLINIYVGSLGLRALHVHSGSRRSRATSCLRPPSPSKSAGAAARANRAAKDVRTRGDDCRNGFKMVLCDAYKRRRPARRH